MGRSTELDTVDRGLQRICDGGTAAVFLVGDIGVGKTEVVNAAAAQVAKASDATVLAGRCLDIGDAPLHPLRQALRQFAQDPRYGGTRRAEVALALLSSLDTPVADSDDAAALLDRVAHALDTIADGGPLVLVIDDLHWADRTTERLLRYLLAGLGAGRLLLLGAARADALDGHRVGRLLDEMRRQPTVSVLELKPLGRVDTEALAERIAGQPLTAAQMDLLWRRSGGNPFVVEVLARGYRDGVTSLPETLRALALSQIGELPPDSHRVAAALAAGVEPVDHPLLATVVKLDEDELFDAVRAAVDRRIIEVGEDGYRFSRAIFKEVLEPRLLPQEQVRLHRRFAEALSDLPGPTQYARLAHHWWRAGEPARALPLAVEAAKRAEDRYAFAEAAEQWTFALDIGAAVPSTVDLPGMRRSAAETAYRIGEYHRALAILDDVAQAAGPAPLPAWWHIDRARYLTAVERPVDAETEYERVLGAADCAPDDRAVAAARSSVLLMRMGRYTEARQRAEEALAMAYRGPDAATANVQAGVALGYSRVHLDDPEAGLAAVEEALRIAERDGRPADVAFAYQHLAELLTGPLNRLDDGIARAREGAERAEQLGIGRTYGVRLLAVAATGLFRSGNWEDADRCVAEALQHRPSGTEIVELLLSRARLYLAWGRLDDAEADLLAVETLTVDGGAPHVLPLITLRAGLAIWRGEHTEARDAAIDGLQRHEGRTDDLPLQVTLLWHGFRAEAEAVTGQHRPADQDAVIALRRLASRIRDLADAAAPPAREAVAGYLALCGAEISRIEQTPDPAAWEHAATLWQSRNQPYPMAYARLRQADALYSLRARDAVAKGALVEAYRVAQELGAVPLARDITELARSARVPLDEPVISVEAAKAAPPNPLDVLTAREYEVFERICAGLTYQEIAAELYISFRTVGVHVSRILAKLNVKNRTVATHRFARYLTTNGDGQRTD